MSLDFDRMLAEAAEKMPVRQHAQKQEISLERFKLYGVQLNTARIAAWRGRKKAYITFFDLIEMSPEDTFYPVGQALTELFDLDDARDIVMRKVTTIFEHAPGKNLHLTMPRGVYDRLNSPGARNDEFNEYGHSNVKMYGIDLRVARSLPRSFPDNQYAFRLEGPVEHLEPAIVRCIETYPSGK